MHRAELYLTGKLERLLTPLNTVQDRPAAAMTVTTYISQLACVTGIAPLLLGLTVAYVLIGGLVNQRKLASFRGPPLAGYSRLWLFLQEIRGRSHFAQKEALEKYGSPARIGPNLLVTDDADLLKHISGPRSGWTRSWWYTSNRFDPRQDTVFSTRDEKFHTELKAKEYGAVRPYPALAIRPH